MDNIIRIIIADDDPIAQMFWNNSLQQHQGYQVAYVTDGKKLIETDLKNTDIIFTDINMPEIDGIKASKIIRNTSKNIPIVAITAHKDSKTKRLCMAAGINEIWEKPIDATLIIKIVNRLTKSREK